MKRIILILVLTWGVVGISGCTSSGMDTNNGQNMVVVVSGAMEPALYRGDIVFVEENPSNIQVGDILVYNATWFNQPVIHRVISVKNDSKGNTVYEMKGDNNPVPDPVLVSKDQIISRVVNTGSSPSVIPKIGYITLWIRGL